MKPNQVWLIDNRGIPISPLMPTGIGLLKWHPIRWLQMKISTWYIQRCLTKLIKEYQKDIEGVRQLEGQTDEPNKRNDKRNLG